LLGLGFGSDASGPQDLAATIAPTPPGRFVPPQPAELTPLFPQLEILELLGQGGMGAVYKARQRQLGRLVALKILPPEVARDPAFAERFRREAQALAQLSHPQIVAVYDSGLAGGLYYFLMEFVDGVNLRRMLADGKLLPAEALAIVPQVCEALQYAHDEGVVHRDIKPENILLDKKGRVKIADFGLARLVGQSRPDIALTGTQQVMGTPHYMAPEQMERPQTVDHRADIYSLGVVFYEMLTGELPLGRFQPPSKKVELDVRLDEVVLRSLEKEPERRYQKVSSVKTEVEAIARSTPPRKTPDHRPASDSQTREENPFAPVSIPAHTLIGLRVSGSLLVLLGLLGSIMGFIGLGAIGIVWDRVPSGMSTASSAIGFIGMFFLGTVVASGGTRVFLQRSYRGALLGCLLSFALALMMNLDEKQNALFLLGFVPGAVALFYLLQPEVRASFERNDQTRLAKSSVPAKAAGPHPPTESKFGNETLEAARDQVRLPAIGLIVLGTIQCAIFGLVLIIGLLGFGFFFARVVPSKSSNEQFDSQPAPPWTHDETRPMEGMKLMEKGTTQESGAASPTAETPTPTAESPPGEPSP
jgi:serine/threonine protein kinase